MNRKYSDEFKAEAVKQVTERGYAPRKVSERLGGIDKVPAPVTS